MFGQTSSASQQGQRGRRSRLVATGHGPKEAEYGNSGAEPWRTADRHRAAAMMLDLARRLVTPSARSEVPPFMVMDVMAAAARIEAAGGRVIHMEVGQPAAPAPATAIAAARAALGAGPLGYTEALGIASLRARIARHYAESYGVDRRARRASSSPPARRPASSWRSWPCSSRATGSAIADPGLSALSPHPHRARLRAGADRDRRGDALCAHRRKPPARRTASKPLDGVLVASPANPTGTMMTPQALADLIDVARRRGHPRHLRRNLSRPRLCVAGGDRAAPVGGRGRHQFVLEIFLHDRLAHRLDGGAGAAGAADRAAAGQSRDLGADAVADRGRGGVRRPRGNGGGQARLRGQPPHPDRRPAEGRARQVPAGRRRVLSLCRRVALLQRQLRFRQAPAGGGARGGDAGRRFRSGQRPATSCASATPVRPPTCARRSSGSAAGCARDKQEAICAIRLGPCSWSSSGSA